MSDTIFALSSAAGRGGVAVVRVSGALAAVSARALAGKECVPRYATFVHLKDDVSRETIDHALVTVFESPKSFTGEDVTEYYVHGGRAVVQSLLEALAQQEGHRMAEPGEFTRRAFENGKIDLTEAEAIADLIDAETVFQKNQALSQLSGALSSLYFEWADVLKRALAHAEADLEFPDEELEDGFEALIKPQVEALLGELADHLDDNRRGERLRDGVQVAIIGAPNAGKSSLLNVLAQRDVAIVSDVAGTTRDVIEVHLDLGGYPVVFLDTAGLRPEHIGADGHDAIENEGMKRALERAEDADLRILIFDGQHGEPDAATLDLRRDFDLCLINKVDQDVCLSLESALKISAKTGAGIPAFLDNLTLRVQDIMGAQSEKPSLTRQRHRFALEECRTYLERSLQAQMPELMAEDLRVGLRCLGRVTGRVLPDDLLDVIFQDFCLGK